MKMAEQEPKDKTFRGGLRQRLRGTDQEVSSGVRYLEFIRTILRRIDRMRSDRTPSAVKDKSPEK